MMFGGQVVVVVVVRVVLERSVVRQSRRKKCIHSQGVFFSVPHITVHTSDRSDRS